MTSEKKIWDQIKVLLKERGSDSLRRAREVMLEESIEYKPLAEVLRYFMEEFWFDALHPTLISLSCEAVGGSHEQTIDLGAAIVLLAGAADIHDDIIDQSEIKEPKMTVFGKFGADLAILAGDALLLKGLYLLQESCENLDKKRKQEIFDAIKHTFFQMSAGVARETELRGKKDLAGVDFIEIIKQKVSTAESTMKIGAILGMGSKNEIEILGNFGLTYGVLLSLRDEFIDIYEIDELKNRIMNESLPFPVLLALQDERIRKRLCDLIENDLTEEKIEEILELVIESKNCSDLVLQMKVMINREIDALSKLGRNKEVFKMLLESTVEDL